MKKIMKKALSLMLTLVMVFALAPMTANAASPIDFSQTGTGTFDDPFVLSTTSGQRWGIYLKAEEEAYVKVDDANGSTVAVSYATTSSYFIQYGPRNQYTATEGDENNATSFQMNSAQDYFYVKNTSTEAGVTLYMSLTAATTGGAEVKGTSDNPEEIALQSGMFGISGEASVNLEADNEGYFYKVTAPKDGALKISVNAYNPDTYAQVGYMYNADNTTKGKYGDYKFSDDENPVDLVEVQAGDVVKIRVTTYNPENRLDVPAGTVRVMVSFYEAGAQAYPVKIVPGDYTANVPTNSWGYYYSYTATAKGTVTITLDENSTNWTYVVNNVTSNGYGNNHYSDDPTPQFSESVSVAAGDEIQVIFGTLDYNAGAIDWSLSFEADTATDDDELDEVDTTGTINDPADLAMGTNNGEIKEGFMYYYTWTAPGKGTLTVYGNELQSPDGYGYVVMMDNGEGFESVGSGSSMNTTEDHQDKTVVYVEKDEVVEVRVYRPDYSLGKFAIQAEFANYAISDTALAVKENAVTLDQNHEYTIYAFEATEDGNYTISTTGATIGNWGTFDWNLNDPNATTNTITMDIIKGQTFYFGVPSDKDSCTVTITYNGNIENDGQTYTAYVNKVTPEAYTFDGEEENLIYIDVTDDVEDVIVLGKDGFYHYGTENGPVVLVDLANETFSLSANVGTAEKPGPSPVKDTINMVDYTEAMLEYVTAADKTTSLYPLTEDLMAVYKNVGIARGWYEASGYGYNLFDGKEMDPEKAWMFTCCYVYEVVDGDGAAWTQGSEEGLTIKANGPFNEFVRLEMDGKEVDKANYTVKEGSTIVILSEDYLATLSVGTHTVTFVYENNGFEYTAETAITIVTPDGTTTDTPGTPGTVAPGGTTTDTPGTPGTVAPGGTTTGDATNIALWVAILGLGVVAIVGSVVMKKRKF